jgi:hypothetical protein
MVAYVTVAGGVKVSVAAVRTLAGVRSGRSAQGRQSLGHFPRFGWHREPHKWPLMRFAQVR